MNKDISIEAAQTQSQVLNGQCDFVESCDSIKEAKARVKRIMSADWQALTEMSEPIRYAQILVNGECIYDYFAKGYNGEQTPSEE